MNIMFIVFLIVLLVYICLGFISRKEYVDQELTPVLRPFTRMALLIHKWICVRHLPFAVQRQVEEDLARLYPGETKERKYLEYSVQKLTLFLIVCLVVTVFGFFVSIQAYNRRQLNCDGSIMRNDFKGPEKNVILECDLGKQTERFVVNVSPQLLDGKQLEEIYNHFIEELPIMILGSNAFLSEVNESLYLVDRYSGYPFYVEWTSLQPEVIQSSGEIVPLESGTIEVELLANIMYENWEREESITVTVVPRMLSEEEKLYKDVEKVLQDSERCGRTTEKWVVPTEVDGKNLSWREPISNQGIWVWISGMAIGVLIYVLSDRDLHGKVEKRKKEMKREYPEVVHKITLYLGAGLTIRKTFQRLAREERRNPVYEEIRYACRELQSGVSEGAVYEHFGKRIGLQEYIRLSTLLAQNLRKGNGKLIMRLKGEAEQSLEARLQHGKRLGEEAMTRMLLPMVMMLLVVMLIIMIPAFYSVGI